MAEDRLKEAEWRMDCLASRMNAAERADAAQVTANVFNGEKYVKLELFETGGTYPNQVYELRLDGRALKSGMSFKEGMQTFSEAKKREDKPVPKKKAEPGGQYVSEMSVFFPKARR